MARRFLCLDIGGTNTRIGLVDEKLEVLDYVIESTPELAADSIAEGLFGLVAAWAERASAEQPVEGVIAGIPATVDAACRRVLQAPNVEGLSGLDLADVLERAAGVPAVVEKDVNLLILSDIHDLGIDPACSVAGIYFGTGIGNALYLDGRVWRGANGVAGELGHIPVLGSDVACGCGNVGCLECYGGGYRLAALMKEHHPDTPIGEAFSKRGDAPEVQGLLEAMAVAVATEANIFDPEHIIVGGGLPAMAGFDRDGFEELVRAHLRKPYPAQTLKMAYSRQGQLSGLIGGAIRLRSDSSFRA